MKVKSWATMAAATTGVLMLVGGCGNLGLGALGGGGGIMTIVSLAFQLLPLLIGTGGGIGL